MIEVTLIKNAAEQALAKEFAGARSTLPGKGTIAALRDDAFKRFDAAGLPHRRVEQWKYTDLRALMREANPRAAPGDPRKPADIAAILPGVEASLVTIVNGRYAPEWSGKNAADPGITVSELFAWLGDNAAYQLGTMPGHDDQASLLNTAFMSGGVAVHVKRGATASKPI